MFELRLSQLAGMNQHYRRYSFTEYLDSMAACEILNLELWCGAPHFLLDDQKYSLPGWYKREAQARGLKFVSVCAPSMQWQYSIGIDGRERIERSLHYYENGVRTAEELGCRILSVNAGWGYRDRADDETIRRAADMICRLASFAAGKGVTLALESLQPSESNIVRNLEEFKKFYELLPKDSVKILLDTVAAGVAGENVGDWFDTFGDQIVHCHFVDGVPSGHRAFGDGEYPLKKMLHSFIENQYTGYFVMELGGIYADDPFCADRGNMAILRNYFH